MLQIGTGKLFTREVEYRNNLKGIIYTNLRLMRDDKIETAGGSLIATENFRESNVLIYELEELIEACGEEPGVLASHGIASFILDFSSILSFALNCTASPSYALTERLLSDEIGVTTHSRPNKVVKQTFDKTIYCHEDHKQFLIHFTRQLIGLERKNYLGVMSAINTYVTGMQRIADDFELAYTLLVASIESLAQDFDGHKTIWLDYEQNKRKAIDEALSDVSDDSAERVRNAILQNEHTSLGKRFREFAIQHITPSFYREEADQAINPLTCFDLHTTLSNAYLARSKYIHNLKKLPKPLDRDTGYTETCRIENKTWLTLQGLSRLARHVIIQFVMRQPTVEREPYNYSLERSNVMQVRLAPQYWIGTVNFNQGSGVVRLEGFLSQFANILEKSQNEFLPNLTDLLTELPSNIDSLKKADKQAFIALYIIYNFILEKSQRLDNAEEFIKKYESQILSPNPSALITNLILGLTPNWNLEDHHDCLMKYFKERDNKMSFRCSQLFESGMLLQLAERYREAGDVDKAIELIEKAVENYPNHTCLRQFEIEFKTEAKPIESNKILLPEIEAEESTN
ncbi:tetratricopeptide repeat protein [Acinetobacter colistiniresistens]|uniref:tetratricopeptide repeat protein n=1 Tax=Acinetobacter colistiniresistens TaxID=280145 RepID=UPI000FDB0FE7|nr:tetratricopeptide repeat protein [Acinetobacter colistiniresistens]